MSTPANLSLAQHPRTPITQFPDHILKNACYEKSSMKDPDAKLHLDYIENQKQDYLLALKYIEENLLSKLKDKPIDKWESKELVSHFEALGKICCKTLVTHELGKFKGSDVQLTGFRQTEMHTTCELTEEMRAGHPELANYKFNLLYPNDIFQVLATTQHLKIAIHFLKWFIKWHPLTKDELVELCKSMKETILRVNQGLLTDPDPKLRCSCNDEILFIYGYQCFQNQLQSPTPEKSFSIVTANLTGQWPKLPDNTLQLWLAEQCQLNENLKLPKAQSNPDWLQRRATDLSLYTPEEISARNLVLRFFPTFKIIPDEMKKLAEAFIEKIKQHKDPIHCACYLHFAISHVLHPYLNGNHRIGRMIMNAILMSFGYSPLEFDEKLRNHYYAAIEKGLPAFEKFIRDRINSLEVQALCMFAREGKLKNLHRLLSYGLSVNATSGAEGWTPLHFACRTKKLDCIESLIKLKADVEKRTKDGKKPVDCLPSLTDMTDAEREIIRKLTQK